MKPFRFLAQALFLSAALLSAQAQSPNTNTVILGQWDFDTAQLEKATVGTNLQFVGFIPTPVTLPAGNRTVGAMAFPALAPDDRILATFAPTNNGGGTALNQYTIIFALVTARNRIPIAMCMISKKNEIKTNLLSSGNNI